LAGNFFSAEDSLDLLERQSLTTPKDINITVLRLPHIANFTDFEPLDAEKTVSVKYIDLQENLGYPDAVIIPGSKTTINDLIALHGKWNGQTITNYVEAGGVILGICGGFQILGEMVFDPDQLEGENESYSGLKLLPIETVITPEKIVRQRQTSSVYPHAGFPIMGYEIHQGITRLPKNKNNPIKTTLHGLF
jgi:adenosylcobyric acid synthase